MEWSSVSGLGILAFIAAAIGVSGQARGVASMRGHPGPLGAAGLAVAIGALAVAAAIAGWIGNALAPGVNLPPQVLTWRAVGAGFLGGVVAALGLPFYYRLMPRLDPELFRVSGELRMRMGLTARVAIGGIIEEMTFRWGALAAIAWATARLTGDVGPAVRWVSILGAALLFGVAHLPGAARLGGGVTSGAVGVGLLVNGWLGIVCGWLVWTHGLAAAIVAHATVHVVWAIGERLSA